MAALANNDCAVFSRRRESLHWHLSNSVPCCFSRIQRLFLRSLARRFSESPTMIICRAGMQPAVTLNPATPVAMLKDIMQDVYMVLLMSVNPGFGGQKFIEHTVEKVRELRALIDSTGSKALIEVDGGVNLETGARLIAAGADALVAGSAVFAAPDPEGMIHSLKDL